MADGRGAARREHDEARGRCGGAGAARNADRHLQAARPRGHRAPALPARHAVPLFAARGGLALPRPRRSRRVLCRAGRAHRLHGDGLLALALPDGCPRVARPRPARLHRVRHATAHRCGRPAACAVRLAMPPRGRIRPTTRATQTFARIARDAGVGALLYRSVRDAAAAPGASPCSRPTGSTRRARNPANRPGGCASTRTQAQWKRDREAWTWTPPS